MTGKTESQTAPREESPPPPKDERPNAPANFPPSSAQERTNKTLPIDDLVAPVIARIKQKAKQHQPCEERKWLEWERRRARDQILRRANLPPKHRAALVQWTPATDWTRAFDALKSKLGLGSQCALLGPRGTGKTQLAVELAKVDAEALRSVRYCSLFEFFLAVKESYHGDDGGLSEARIIAQFAAPSLLILDEAQERGESAWEDHLITYLIDKRYRHEKDTLLISNLVEQHFRDTFRDSIISRVEETGGFIHCTWKSFRLE